MRYSEEQQKIAKVLLEGPKTLEQLREATGLDAKKLNEELKELLKLKVVERKIDKSELYLAQEAFFTGTAVQIAWIKEIDGRIIGNGKRGKITKKLQELFFEIVRGNNKKYSPKWCTKVKI